MTGIREIYLATGVILITHILQSTDYSLRGQRNWWSRRTRLKMVLEGRICTLETGKQVGRDRSWTPWKRDGRRSGRRSKNGTVFICVKICFCYILRIIMAHTFIHCYWNWENFIASIIQFAPHKIVRRQERLYGQITNEVTDSKRLTLLGKQHVSGDWWGRD